jgi:CheY-like chemotaxis protein
VNVLLIVDDEYAFVAALQALLGEDGWRVLGAADGHEGLATLRASEPPTICLIDLMMPGMGGLELLRAMRDDPALASIPTVATSAGPRESEARAAGATAFLKKPFALGELTALLAQVVAAQGTRASGG